jgi:serine/threonine protein phosphatase PrpC
MIERVQTDEALKTDEGVKECKKIRREGRRKNPGGEDEEDDDDEIEQPESGSTAVTCLIVGQTLYCANAGDSRAVQLFRAPSASRATHPRTGSRWHRRSPSHEFVRPGARGAGFVSRWPDGGAIERPQALQRRGEGAH